MLKGIYQGCKRKREVGDHMGNLKKTYWSKAIAFSLLIACLGIVPHIIEGCGCLMMSNDYAALFVPQTMMTNKVIKSGSLLWNWGIDLGGNYLESIGIGSVFSLLLLLCPTEYIPYAMGWMVILKFVVAALTSSLYFKRQFNDELVVVICSLLYSFSGYQIAAIVFWCFQDVTALFPLLLLGIELLVEEKRRGILLLATILNISCGLVFFFGEVIFLLLYFIIKYIRLETFRNKELLIDRIKAAVDCIFEGVSGVLCAGIIVIPSLRNLLTNNRISNHISASSWFTITTTDLLQTIKAFLLPAEPMSNQASVVGSNWYSNALYLPVVGMIFAVSYLLVSKDWKSRLAKVCLIISIVPLFNSMFMFCNWEPYKRWYYMLSLVVALITGCVLENPKCFPVLKSSILNLSLIALFVLMTSVIKWNSGGGTLVFQRGNYYLSIAISLLGILICVVHLKARETAFHHIVLTAVVLFSSVLILLHIENCKGIDNSFIDFRSFTPKYSKNVTSYITETSNDLPEDTLPYRYYFDENIGYTYYNLSMPQNLPSINSFCTTVHGSVTDFYNNLGVGRHTMTISVGNGMKELLAAKYIVSVAERPEYKLLYTKTLRSGQVIYYYENDGALPIGFTYDQYITESEFKTIDPNYRPVVMANALVIKDDAEASVSQSISRLENYDLDVLLSHINRTLDERKKESSIVFEYADNTFSSTIETDAEKYAFFSVPFDDCWSATVNDETADILNVEGLMAVHIPAGKSIIVFEYNYTPLKYGLLISMAGIGISSTYVCIYKRKRLCP